MSKDGFESGSDPERMPRISGPKAARGRRRTATAAPQASRTLPPPGHRIRPSFWRVIKALANLGAFLMGASAGYFFSKAENRATRYGRTLMGQMMKSMGDEDEEENGRREHVPDRGRGRDRDSADDPMGEGFDDPFQEEDP